MARSRVRLIFAAGIDRASGHLTGEAPRDLRNVYFVKDKIQLRNGLTLASTISGASPPDRIVLIHEMRTEAATIVVAYRESDRALLLYRAAIDGASPQLIGSWGTLPAGAVTPPRLLATEIGRKLFIAHEEPSAGNRLQTIYYDPLSATPINYLSADLNRDGTAEAVRFRGVASYLQYLVGWGFGTGSDPDRPEVLRVSQPGEPTSFDPDHYFIVGLRTDPVMNALPGPGRLVVLKATSTYDITGYDQFTFSLSLGDPFYGLSGSRLAVSLAGTVYFWSHAGPRTTNGGPSVDLAWPLELKAPPPADLVAEGAPARGVAVYLPDRQTILFIFERRVYTLSLWGGIPRWSYSEFPFSISTAATIRTVEVGSGGPPTAYATAVSGTGKSGTTDVLTVNWTNNSALGDEIIEIHLQPSGGSWFLAKTLNPSGTTQSTDIPELAAGRTHNIAIRYRRGPYYTAGYENPDPSLWPTQSKGSGTTNLKAPTFDSTQWQRTSANSERVRVTFTPAHSDVDVVIKRSNVTIATVTAAQHQGGTYTYDDTTIAGETLYTYSVLHRRDIDSAEQSKNQYTGPNKPTDFMVSAVTECAYLAEWTAGDSAAETEVEDNYPAGTDYSLKVTVPAGNTQAPVSYGATCGGTIRSYSVRVRHKLVQYNVADYSEYAPPRPVDLCDVCT
ncbi:MAG: hypothetical protein ONB52_21925 [candidate division KSB1 bacterium]|nr:hypothetical protein [candidate division KSB1 bacterium]